MISASLNTFLRAQSSITTLASTRIYPIILPQKPTFPAVTYREESHDLIESFDGQNGLTQSFYMLDAWAKTYASVTALNDAIRTALKNHSGAMGSISVTRVTLVSGPISVYEDEVEAYRQTQVFSIWHKEV